MKSKKKINNILVFMFTFFIILLSLSTSVVKADTSGAIGFAVEAVESDNQITPGLGYFELKVEKGQNQVLEIIIKNTSDEQKTFEIEVMPASSSAQGTVNYIPPEIVDEDLNYPFPDIAKSENDTIVIEAKGEKTEKITVNFPDTDFDGIILGGIRVKDITAMLEREATKEESSGSGMVINQNYEFLIAVIARQNDTETTPDFELIRVETGLDNYSIAIFPVIKNKENNIVKGAIFSGQIIAVGDTEPIFAINGKEINMAPTSIMRYSFQDEAGFGIRAGDYKFTGKMEYKGQIWDFEENFTIENEEASDLNAGALNQQNQRPLSGGNNKIIIIAIVAVVVILLILLVVTIVSRKSRQSKRR